MTVGNVTSEPTERGQVNKGSGEEVIEPPQERPDGVAPLQPDQEWANALTHAIAALGALAAGGVLLSEAWERSLPLGIACAAYAAAAFGTFFFSTLSHAVHRQPWLNLFRAWDQAMIYLMITGTYTPIVFVCAPEETRTLLLAAIWLAAIIGFLTKVAMRHRINAIGTVSYLLLGWLPALPLVGHVPEPLVESMITGGVIYTVGIAFLINDARLRYLHAAWHLCVMAAALVHFWGILQYCVLDY